LQEWLEKQPGVSVLEVTEDYAGRYITHLNEVELKVLIYT
jgi:hypothetical protein